MRLARLSARLARDSRAPVTAVAVRQFSGLLPLQSGLLSSLKKSFTGILAEFGDRLVKSSAEKARLGRLLHYNLNYRASRSPSLQLQCGKGLVLGMPSHLAIGFRDGDGSGKANAEGFVAVPATVSFPVIPGPFFKPAAGDNSRGGEKEDFCGALHIRAFIRPSQARAPPSSSSASAATGGKPKKGKDDAAPTSPESAIVASSLTAALQAISTSPPSSLAALSPDVSLFGSKELAALDTFSSLVPSLRPLTTSVDNGAAGAPGASQAAASVEVPVAVRSRSMLALIARSAASVAARTSLSSGSSSVVSSPAAAEDASRRAAEAFLKASEGALDLARRERMKARFEKREKGQDQRQEKQGASKEEQSRLAMLDALGSPSLFVSEQLEDLKDEARCKGLAPAVCFEVLEAVFIPATAAGAKAAGAKLDVTRELRGIAFDDLPAIAEGAASFLLAQLGGGDGGSGGDDKTAAARLLLKDAGLLLLPPSSSA